MGSKFSSSDFELYTRKIKDYTLLTPEEELDYARRYLQGDIQAGQKIITSNLRFVVKIAQGYFHLGYGPLEVVQEGNMGLVKALTRFDPEMGVRFICYAIWWIKAYIKNFIHKSYQVHTGRLTHAKGLVSLDSSLCSETDNEESLLDHLLYEGPDQDDFYTYKERRIYLLNLLKADPPILSKREVFIIKKRFFSDPPATLKDIAMEIGVTRERVRQIEMRSLQRIKAAIEEHNDIHIEDIHIGHEYPIRRRKI
ncbi:MAG TPA: sigma-70 family RNA polymerase sigma factor [Deltaproteobacteria bacterium]|nr:sigma-70 family RNA polymerase sigma factor [Deltaproteobacteria bacterium]